MSLIQTAVIMEENLCYETIILVSNINMAMNKVVLYIVWICVQSKPKSEAFVSMKVNSFW